jgi:hypothetical protein
VKHILNFSEALKTIDYKDMTNWESTKPIDKKLDIDDVKEVFLEYLDSGAKLEYYENQINEFITVELNSPNDEKYGKIEDLIKFHQMESEFLENIMSCFNRLEDLYNNLMFYIDKNDGFDPIGGSMKDVEFGYMITIIKKL